MGIYTVIVRYGVGEEAEDLVGLLNTDTGQRYWFGPLSNKPVVEGFRDILNDLATCLEEQ